MSRRLRRLGQIGIALLLVLGAAVALVLWHGGEMLRATLEAALQARLMPTVRLGAPLRWRLLPQPQVIVRDVSLTEASGASVLALAELRVALDGAALSEGRLDIASVDVDGLELTLAHDAAGGWNAARWLRAAPDDAAPTPMVPIGRLGLVNGRVRVAGEISADIAGVTLNMAPLRPGAAGEFTLAARADVPSAALADVRIDAAGQFVADMRQPRLEHLTLEGVGKVGAWSVDHAVVRAARVEPEADGGLHARDLTLDLAAQSEAARIETQVALATLSANAANWHAEALQVRARGEQGSRSVAATLQAERVQADGAGWALPDLALQASSSGAAPAATLSLTGAARFHRADGAAQVALAVREARTSVPHPADASATLDLAWSGHARYDLASAAAAGELAGSFDQSRFDGRWTFDPHAPAPVKVSATLDRLDLDRYLPPAKADAEAADGANLAPWRNWPVSADLRVGELRVRGFVSQAARLRLGGGLTGGP